MSWLDRITDLFRPRVHYVPRPRADVPLTFLVASKPADVDALRKLPLSPPDPFVAEAHRHFRIHHQVHTESPYSRSPNWDGFLECLRTTDQRHDADTAKLKRQLADQYQLLKDYQL